MRHASTVSQLDAKSPCFAEMATRTATPREMSPTEVSEAGFTLGAWTCPGIQMKTHLV